jgi:hypothetical protein
MRRLHIRRADVQTFQQLAGLIILPQLTSTGCRGVLAPRRAEALWRQGISGDLPIAS